MGSKPLLSGLIPSTKIILTLVFGFSVRISPQIELFQLIRSNDRLRLTVVRDARKRDIMVSGVDSVIVRPEWSNRWWL